MSVPLDAIHWLRHLYVVAVFCTLGMVSAPLSADTFLGRQIEVTDGRSDANATAPLIIVLHGFLGSGANMRKKTGFDDLAAMHELIVAYSSGKFRSWNDGRSAGNRVDDVGYLSALIGAFIARGHADPARVFLVGHSNGGGMAMRMACDRPDLIRGIAVVATKSPLKGRCMRGKPMPALFMHGTDDPISRHGGRAGASRLGAAHSSERTLQFWQRQNRCDGIAETRRIDARDDGTAAIYTRYAGCAAALVYLQINGHGHDWPGPRGRTTSVQGRATREVDGAVVSWWFFGSL